MQYCIYLRKSRADLDVETRGEGDTLIRHECALTELAYRQKLDVTKVYKEVVSGETIAARPVMQRLLAEVGQGVWTGVLVMEVERLARGDTIDQGIMAQTFKYSNTKIITPTKTYDPNNEFDEEYFEFGLFMSRREYKTINRRLQRGRLSSVKEGKYVGSNTPYGYVRKKIEHNKGFTLEPHPEESEIIKFIFELYTRGEKQSDGSYKRLGVSLICRKLNELRVKPKKSDVWVPASIRDILTNPVYAGKIRWNWRPAIKKIVDGDLKIERPRSDLNDCVVVDGLHDAIISLETWNLVQHYMKQNPLNPLPGKHQLKNPLSGIVFCGVCGRRLVRRPFKNSAPDTLMCPAASCTNVSSRLSIVEDHILFAISKWLSEYRLSYNIDIVEPYKSIEMDIKKKSLKRIDNEIANIKTQIANLHDLLERGIYSPDVFLERSIILSDKMESVRQDRVSLSNVIDLEIIPPKTYGSVIPKVEQILDVYSNAETPKEKNNLLKEILERVNYTKNLNTRWHGSPHDFEIELMPKFPR